ncbi:MAG: RluA family pseudouridine synthase [Candidatus Moranbacteria bacterium]|nr:RluA family pseudouridine synthase [Candidatus Moranbacteria bacterium]
MQKIVIDENGAGERIDKFLKEEFFLNVETTRGDVIRSIKEGQILLNNKKVKPSYILKDQDIVMIDIQKEKEEVIPNKDIKLEIIFQDKDIIVINKPSGLQVHPSDTEKENTLVNALIVAFPEIKDVNDGSEGSWMRPGIVHRLDKDTSGAMVVAKNKKTFDELKRQFADREIEKNYVALVYGHLAKNEGVVDQPIARAASFKKQKIARGRTKGIARPALTEYKLLKRFAEFDFVEAVPKTGRMHQIRVHMSSLGNSIVGDAKYKRRNLILPDGVLRQLLHAQKLKFTLFGKAYAFEAPLPADFAKFMQSLD